MHKILVSWILISLVLVIVLAIEEKGVAEADVDLAEREQTAKPDIADDLVSDFEDFSVQKIDQILI